MVTKERFEQGLTLQQYVDHMSVNRERFVEALDEVTIRPDEAQILERLGGTRRVLVISEDSVRHLSGPRALRGQARRGPRERRDAALSARRESRPHGPVSEEGPLPLDPRVRVFDEHMNELARFLETRPS